MNPKHHNRPVDRPAYTVPGAISANEIYRSDEAKARAGWRDSAFRAACRRGLKIHRYGKRTYVTGAALVAFITKQPEGVPHDAETPLICQPFPGRPPRKEQARP